MARQHVVRRGDTISKICKTYYGTTNLAARLSAFNGIRDVNKIFVGQIIEIPSKKQLIGSDTADADESFLDILPPIGLEGIIKEFGDIYRYIREDGTISSKWEEDCLSFASLPFPISLSWDNSQRVSRFRCSKKLVGVFEELFLEIQNQGFQDLIYNFGGCYSFRPKRTASKLSTHSWGISVDLNPNVNPSSNAKLVPIFERFGFQWGGYWPGKFKDPMHFQFCSGY